MKLYLSIMLAGALGVATRALLSAWVAERIGTSFPLGTMIVNITGCLFMGIFGGLTKPDGLLLVSPVVRQMVMIGFLGGFTTFSSFSWQTFTLIEDGEWLYATLNVVCSVACCLAATWLGITLTNLFNQQ